MAGRSVDEVLRSVCDVLYPGDDNERPVNLQSRSSEGDTPLHVMAWRKDVEGASILIGAGADVDAVGDMDQTPLHVAIMQTDLQMIDLLLKSGARTDLRSEFGQTAAEEADEKGGVVQQTVRSHART